jgi:polyphosphate kinase 2 (PPK2 family)
MAKHRQQQKPFDGAISRFVEKEAPEEIRRALADAGKHDILDPRYPYRTRLDKDAYGEAFEKCQLELVKVQTCLRAEGRRVVILFEGRDAAGKGGTIEAFTENLNPRHTRVVALPAPSDVEWYF